MNALELHRCCHYRRVQDGSLIPRFGRARRDPALAVLEGLHPLKHALRFDADLLEAVTDDAAELQRLVGELAPDLGDRLRALVREIEPEVFERLAPLTPSTGVMAVPPGTQPGDGYGSGGGYDAPGGGGYGSQQP